MPPKQRAAKAKETVTAASGADAGAAVASRVRAARRARTVTPLQASRARPWKARPPRTAKPMRTKATNSPAWPAAISLPMASGARAAAAVAADAAGVARLEDGLAGSIADELGPTPAPEVDQRGCRFRRRRVRARAIAGAGRRSARTGFAAGGDAACGLCPARAGRERARADRRRHRRKRPSAPRRGGVRPCARKSAS